MKIMSITTAQNKVQKQQTNNVPAFNGWVKVAENDPGLRSVRRRLALAQGAFFNMLHSLSPSERQAQRGTEQAVRSLDFSSHGIRDKGKIRFEFPGALDRYVNMQMRNLQAGHEKVQIEGVLKEQPFSIN